MFKVLLSFILIFNFICTPVLAIGLDTSVDDEIRKNYNPEKIEEDLALPVLPKILSETKSYPKPISQTQYLKTNQAISDISKGNYATIKKGTKIKVKLLSAISDRTKRGTQLNFISKYPVSTTYYTIPMGTIFQGEIIQSHRPQLSGNGGLIVIKINSVVLNNEVHPLNADITEANFKKIFFNNIKGERKYLNSMLQSIKPGFYFCTRMFALSGNLATEGSNIILAPFAIFLGVFATAGNIFVSPALALFYKGNSIYFREGSNFEIKLAQDVFISER